MRERRLLERDGQVGAQEPVRGELAQARFQRVGRGAERGGRAREPNRFEPGAVERGRKRVLERITQDREGDSGTHALAAASRRRRSTIRHENSASARLVTWLSLTSRLRSVISVDSGS